jgi:hypothetical protein
MSRQKVDSEMIVSIAASKLSGALPALDGSALTGIAGMLKGASDPLLTTNPAGGVGSLYLNTADGEMFCCTDATTDNNVWTNVGGGSGDVAPIPSMGQATISGYSHGGVRVWPTINQVIDKFPYASQTNASPVGDLTHTFYFTAGASSGTNGYAFATSPVNDIRSNIVNIYSHTTDGPASEHGDLFHALNSNSSVGISDQGNQNGYCVTGGYLHLANQPYTTIQKFAFSSNTTATNAGDILSERNEAVGASSQTHGYIAGGYNRPVPPTNVDVATIEKFSFATETDAASIGTITTPRANQAGCSSETHGYQSSGSTINSGIVSNIDRWSFATDGNAVGHGDLSTSYQGNTACSSVTHGYSVGGQAQGGGGEADTIEKFAFSSNTTATDWADLTVIKVYASTSQV